MRKIGRRNTNILLELSKLISLEGKKTLISGAGSGIGRAIAKRFAEAGSDLVLLDIDERGLCQTRDTMQKFTSRVSICKLDLSKKAQIDSLWEDFNDEIPDILINNAGIYPFKNYLELDEDELKKTMDVNLNSIFWMCQNFIKKRINKGGIIVNLSSIEAILPFKEDLAHYSVSKAGVLALTRSLARDYGRNNFRINTILPGAIKTPGTDNLVKMAISKMKVKLIKTGYDFQNRLALGRWGNPDEVAKVALFLCSDLASYVQGVMLPVDGGFLSS
jgi:NAD(P)-dependent dehydrogenase (short-subunit alcohol dehydrogenase family)